MAFEMGSDLYNRLKQLKREREGGGPAGTPGGAARSSEGAAPRPPSTAGVAASQGFRVVAEGVWRRTVFTPSDHAAYLEALLQDGRGSGIVPQGFDADHLVFFDAETTGLSSGAGTTAFLVGFGRLGAGGITTEQLFMADYPAEPAFLKELGALLGEEDLAVSYNGKGFDSHVLRTRHLLHGMRLPLGAQLDLLYTTRRLWQRRLTECSLGTVERMVLGVVRDRDLPSAEVPERYFAFLRSADSSLLEEVFAHHLKDIESLVGLLAEVERTLAEPSTAVGVDPYGLGRMLLARDREEGEYLLETVIDSEPSVREALRAAGELARHRRRAGRFEAAASVWKRVLQRHASVTAGIEVAKHLEHKRRDFAAAEELVRKLLSWPHSLPYRGELEHRLGRLERRSGRQPSSPR